MKLVNTIFLFYSRHFCYSATYSPPTFFPSNLAEHITFSNFVFFHLDQAPLSQLHYLQVLSNLSCCLTLATWREERWHTSLTKEASSQEGRLFSFTPDDEYSCLGWRSSPCWFTRFHPIWALFSWCTASCCGSCVCHGPFCIPWDSLNSCLLFRDSWRCSCDSCCFICSCVSCCPLAGAVHWEARRVFQRRYQWLRAMYATCCAWDSIRHWNKSFNKPRAARVLLSSSSSTRIFHGCSGS